MRRRNVIAALVLIAVGVGYGYLTSRLPVRTLPNTPDPAFFPWLNTVVLLGLAAVLLFQGVAVTARGGSEAAAPSPLGHAPVLWALAAFVGYLAVLPTLGFVIATVPFFAVLMVVFGERRAAWVAAGSVGVPVLLFAIFRYGFGILLPLGPLAGVLR